MESFGKAEQFPYAATTYRLTEHMHFWTKNVESNAIVQPEQFVEIGEKLAKAKGIGNGDEVKVSSNRGEIRAKAVVTRRIADLTCNGKEVMTVGIPIHWGFIGVAKSGYLANTLTPYRRRCQFADAGIQGVLGQHRESVGGNHAIYAITRHTKALGNYHRVATGAHRRRAPLPS